VNRNALFRLLLAVRLLTGQNQNNHNTVNVGKTVQASL
jgi:hypothetical protein